MAKNVQQTLDEELNNACCLGRLEDTKQAIRNGANPNWIDDDGRTALMHAARLGKPMIVKYLVEETTAQVDTMDKNGLTALMLAVRSDNTGPDLEETKMYLELVTKKGADTKNIVCESITHYGEANVSLNWPSCSVKLKTASTPDSDERMQTWLEESDDTFSTSAKARPQLPPTRSFSDSSSASSADVSRLQFMETVASKISAKWKRVGIALGIEQNDIDAIEMHRRGDPLECFSDVYTRWKQQSTPQSPVIWATLVTLLQSNYVGEKQLSDTIQDELEDSIRSNQSLVSINADEVQVKKLTDLHMAFDHLLLSFENELLNCSKAQEIFVQFLSLLFCKVGENSFQTLFQTLIDEEVSLFNIHYLKQICKKIPEDVCASFRQLVDEYELESQTFRASTTVYEFKQLFPTSAAPFKLLTGKETVTLKFKDGRGEDTIEHHTIFIALFGVSASHLHLFKIEDNCSVVIWLCSVAELKQLKMAISETADSLQGMGVQQVMVGKEIVLQPDHSAMSTVIVPDVLVKKLATLRFAFAKLLRKYERELQCSPQAQEEFVEILPRLFSSCTSEHGFHSAFKNFAEKQVSLFNIYYLEEFCEIFPEDVAAATKEIVHDYETRLEHFMNSATVNHFKHLFPACAPPLELGQDKLTLMIKLENEWGDETLNDLKKLVIKIRVPKNHLYLYKVEYGCIAVTWLCSTVEVKQLKLTICEAAYSLQKMGVLQVFIGEELVVECSRTLSVEEASLNVKQLIEDDDVQSNILQPQVTESSKSEVTINLAQETDIEYQCSICTEPLMEPFLSIECGHHLCGQCRDRLISSGKSECPECREPDALTTAVLDKNYQRKVERLKVRCSDYKNGCDWVGKLKELHDHVDPEKGQCGIPCPFGCGKYCHSSEMKKHTLDCDKRTISCGKCGYYNTYTIVTENHYPICPQSTKANSSDAVSPQYLYNQAPMEFTISEFSEKKRKWLSLPIYTHNRGYKFCLNVHPNGCDTGKGSHISVYAQLMRGEYDDNLKWPFEGDIQIQLLNWKEDKKHHSDTICFNRYSHTVSRLHSYRLNAQETAISLGHPKYMPHTDLEPTTDTKYLLNDYFKLRVTVAVYSTPPRPLTPKWQGSLDSSVVSQFTITEYSKRKQFNNIYYSPPFTTSRPRGYKFCLKIYANGYGSGKGSHVKITALIMKGPCDDQLKWPFSGTLIVEVLNWLENKRHHKRILSIDTNDGFDKVTRGEYGKDYGLHDFIPQSSLPLDSSTNTQFLYQDCICIRVRNS